MSASFKSKVWAEGFGTAFLLMIVVGSGIMAERLSGLPSGPAAGQEALALLANSLATGFGLFVLIEALGPISGAHFNPVVSLTELLRGGLRFREFLGYGFAQIGGAIFGVIVTHLMFGLPALQIASKPRPGLPLLLSEFIATFGLIAVIALGRRASSTRLPVMVAAYITSAYWFTASTSFANPAVTVARMFTDTFCGIAPAQVAGFVLAQIGGALLARRFFRSC
jgi:glycerol uptake facilitator-like aquaporin